MSIQKILIQYEPVPENVLRAVKDVNRHNGYLSENDCEEIAKYFSWPLARIYSLASFFDEIRIKKDRKIIIKVCSGGPCLMEKSQAVTRQIEMLLKLEAENDGSPKYKLELMSCKGLCDRGPIVMIGDQIFEKVNPENIDDIIKDYL
ncbi:MAG: NAD(P)H-dependent oxidoreductase subunit E [Parcubacteria group bacterium]|jgi:NADH-quinone oxidoreductase subunit E